MKRACIAVLAFLPLLSCTNTWLRWAWRDPHTLEEWKEFNAVASERLDAISKQCAELRQRDSPNLAACEHQHFELAERIGRAYDATHPHAREQRAQEARAAAERAETERKETERAAAAAQARTQRQQEEERKKLLQRAYVVDGKLDATGHTIGCGDVLTLKAALEYFRVGDWEKFDQLVGGMEGSCQILRKGQVVIPDTQRSEYWRVGVAMGDFPFPVGFWVRAADLRKASP